MDEDDPSHAPSPDPSLSEPLVPPSGSASPASRSPASPPDDGRRGTLRLLIGAGTAAYAAALAVPGYRFVADGSTAARAGAADAWVRVFKLSALPEGTPTRVALVADERDAFTVTRDQRVGSVWLLRIGGTVRALSATCPHLGCAIDLRADGKAFACPCHASRFSLDGTSEAGPSPRAMDPLATRVVDGFVEVEHRRYRQGTAERVAVG